MTGRLAEKLFFMTFFLYMFYPEINLFLRKDLFQGKTYLYYIKWSITSTLIKERSCLKKKNNFQSTNLL